MSMESIKLAIAFAAPPEVAFIGSIDQVNIRVTAKVCFTDKAFVALKALVRLVISLQ